MIEESMDEFEVWWQSDGQYGRAGGGDYEKTFAFNAWNAAPKSAPPAWIPIETAPKDGTDILVCKSTDADGNPMGDSFGLFVQRVAWWELEGWVVYCGMVQDPHCFFEPTHWMPIPKAP